MNDSATTIPTFIMTSKIIKISKATLILSPSLEEGEIISKTRFLIAPIFIYTILCILLKKSNDFITVLTNHAAKKQHYQAEH